MPKSPSLTRVPPWLSSILVSSAGEQAGKSTTGEAAVALPCTEEGLNSYTAEAFALPPCSELKKRSKIRLNLRIANVIAQYYEGTQLFFDDPFSEARAQASVGASGASVELPMTSSDFCVVTRRSPVPVCVLPAEVEDNVHHDSCGIRSPRPDGFCVYTDKGVDFQTCSKEYAWFMGLKVRVWAHYLEQVLAEIDTGAITLTRFPNPNDATREIVPCQGFADRIVQLLNDSAEGPGFLTISARLGYALGLNSQCQPAYTFNTTDLTSSNKADKETALRGLHLAATMTFASDGTLASSMRPTDPNIFPPPPAACLLRGALDDIESLFDGLAACEVMYRSFPGIHKYSRFAPVQLALTEKVVMPCAAYAAKKAASIPTESTIIKSGFFYDCYEKNVRNFFEKSYYDQPELSVKMSIPYLKTTNDLEIPNCLLGGR